MTEQQFQDIAMGVVAAAMESNDLVMGIDEERQPLEFEEMPPEQPMEGMQQ
jgi:hypothetical protein